jgi:feruloyl esterase
MTSLLSRHLALALALVLARTSLANDKAVAMDSESKCEALSEMDFSTVPDAPTRITAAKLVRDGVGTPSCEIDAYVAPQVGLQLRLPVNTWNGKFIEVGCGGWCGSIASGACDRPLQKGYACAASDMGHKGDSQDLLWASNNLPAQSDFGFRATHVAALAGKAIAEHYYGSQPRHSYFLGCSTGGYQGVMEAQRFPWDFDGIVAGAPDIDEPSANLRALWAARAFLNDAGKPRLTDEQLNLVHAAVLARCDMDDGVRDGIIGNPLSCQFDPKELQCATGHRSNECLTAAQVEVVRKLYAGPMTTKGEKTSTGGFLPGSELLWGDFWPAESTEQFFRFALAGFIPAQGRKEWTYKDFDFDRDYRRLGGAPWYDNSNPDLRKFKQAGGKLLVYHGGNDTVDLPGAVIDYYETVERTMGGRAATQQFFRMFLIPGMNHCWGGSGAYAIDYLQYMEQWVESGKAPEVMVGSHVSDVYLLSLPLAEKWTKLADALHVSLTKDLRLLLAESELKIPLDPAVPISFTRSVYPYPATAKYSGHGDVNDAASFVPVH